MFHGRTPLEDALCESKGVHMWRFSRKILPAAGTLHFRQEPRIYHLTVQDQ